MKFIQWVHPNFKVVGKSKIREPHKPTNPTPPYNKTFGVNEGRKDLEQPINCWSFLGSFGSV
jgi:hypothetical protein